MKQLLVRQWFLFALAAILFLGFAFSKSLKPIADADSFRKYVLVVVLFLMALPVESSTILQTLRRPWAAVLGSVLNMVLLPIVAWCMAMGLRGEMSVGLIIAATSPCTLASAAVWTRRAGGNDTVAIFITILTNATCFLLTPFWLSLLLRESVQVNTQEMIEKLALLVVLPMVAAQILRQWKPFGMWATANKKRLSTIAQSGILVMVLVGAIRCGLQLGGSNWQQQLAIFDFGSMVMAVLLLHLSILYFGRFAAASLGFSRQDQVAVAIGGSQKTLMVGLYVAIHYFGGLTMLPMVAYHVGQLVFDTVIADRWAASDANVSA